MCVGRFSRGQRGAFKEIFTTLLSTASGPSSLLFDFLFFLFFALAFWCKSWFNSNIPLNLFLWPPLQSLQRPLAHFHFPSPSLSLIAATCNAFPMRSNYLNRLAEPLDYLTTWLLDYLTTWLLDYGPRNRFKNMYSINKCFFKKKRDERSCCTHK